MKTRIRPVQRIAGLVAAAAFFVIAWQSMTPGFDLSMPMVAGLLLVIAMLLGKVEQLAELVEKYNTQKRIAEDRIDRNGNEDQ